MSDFNAAIHSHHKAGKNLEDKEFDQLGHIAKAIGMSKIAEQTGMSRPSLYKALAENAKPQFDTILKVLRAIGGNIKMKPSI